MAPDPRAERGALPQTGGLWKGGPRAALRGLLVKLVRSQREANSQWKSESSFHSADILIEQQPHIKRSESTTIIPFHMVFPSSA